MPAVNLSKKTWIATTIGLADTILGRLVGLLGRRSLEPEEALWIVPCKSVHTIGMRFPIDVVFLTKKHVVVETVSHLLPGRLTKWHFSAYSVLELPAGAVNRARIAAGDQLDISTVGA